MKPMKSLLCLLLLAPLSLLAQQGPVPPELIRYPELILHNGKILTVDETFRTAEAVAIRDGLFLSVGTNAEVLRLKGPETKVVDLQGKTRRDDKGRVGGPDHGIDRPTALRMTTLWAARFIGEDQNLGSIEKGKKADLAVLGADYLTVPEDKISEILIVATVVGGKVVYGSL